MLRFSLRATVCLAVSIMVAAGAACGHREQKADEGVIVYWSENPWPSIWRIRPDGSGDRRILRNHQNAKRPRLSPDGRLVAFDGASPGKPPLSDFDIQLVRLDGSGLRTVTDSPRWDVDAQWSPDGERIAFTRGRRGRLDWPNTEIWIVNRDGSGTRRIGPGSDARWSPDGTTLAFAAPTAGSDADLFVAAADGTGRRQLTATPALESPAGWSPDGETILFNRSPHEYDFSIYVVDADGTEERRLTAGVAAGWSPDGSKILFTESWPGALAIMDADGSDKRRVGVIGADPFWGA